MSTTIIGIGHKARNGKDTLGQILADDYGFTVLHFADALKREAADVGWHPANKNQLATDLLSEVEGHQSCSEAVKEVFHFLATHPQQHPKHFANNITYLQWHGSQYRRFRDQHYWVRKTHDDIHNLQKTFGTTLFAICDMRFANEFELIERMGGFTVDVQRIVERRVAQYNASLVPEQFIDPDRDRRHPSECELDVAAHNFVLRCTSIEDLKDKTASMINIIHARNITPQDWAWCRYA